MSQTVCETGKASFQVFIIPLICSVIIITLQIKGTLNMLTFYHINKINAELL